MPPSPSPKHIVRSHLSPISTLFVSDRNERVYSGDSSGVVAITSTRTLRPLAVWNAHTDGLLGVQEWGECIITSVGISIALGHFLTTVILCQGQTRQRQQATCVVLCRRPVIFIHRAWGISFCPRTPRPDKTVLYGRKRTKLLQILAPAA
jgi:hypothetical protein